MTYKVVITKFAQSQIESYVDYILKTFKSNQAAKDLISDFKDTVKSLSFLAGSLTLLDDSELRKRSIRKINLKKHRYLILYRIVNNVVSVEAVYHVLQDYNNIFTNR